MKKSEYQKLIDAARASGGTATTGFTDEQLDTIDIEHDCMTNGKNVLDFYGEVIRAGDLVQFISATPARAPNEQISYGNLGIVMSASRTHCRVCFGSGDKLVLGGLRLIKIC